MATVTGLNLLEGVLESLNVTTLSPLVKAALAARLQQAIDVGTDSNLQIAAILAAIPAIRTAAPEGQPAGSFIASAVGEVRTEIEADVPATFTLEGTVVTAPADVEQIRATFASAEVGNGNENNTDSELAVAFQQEDALGALTGDELRGSDEGVTYTAANGQTFDVRDISGTQRGDTFTHVVLGTAGDDTLTAAETDTYINAGAGNDTLVGGAGADFLVGGAGDDTIHAGAGDKVIAGAGADVVVVTGNRADYTVADTETATTLTNADGVITLVKVAGAQSTETVRFADGDVTIAELLNNAPVVTGVIAAQTLKSANNLLFAEASVSDIDGVNSAELTTDAELQVSSSVAEDVFAFAGTNVAFVANLVTVGGVGVATFTQAEGVLTVTFGSDDPATVINADTVNTVLQALQLNADPNSGERTITLTVTDALGGQSQAVQTLVTSLPENFTAPTITNFDGEKIIAAQADAIAVDVAPNATVAFVANVGLNNVDGLTLTLTLSGDTANSDVLALPTELDGNGSVAVIGGRLVYQINEDTQLNLGTVSGGTNGQPLLITLAANPNLAATAEKYDAALGLVLNSVTFDADSSTTVVEGPRTLTATLGGLVGVEEVSASTTLVVVTSEGEIPLTTGVDTLGDAQFINLFRADLEGETQTLNTVTGSGGGSDTLTGGATAFDTLTATLNAAAGAVTITDVDRLNLTAGGDSGALDFANITNADFAMQVVVDGSGKLNLTKVANVESIDAGAASGDLTVSFADGESATVTTGGTTTTTTTTITANDLATSDGAPAVDAVITVAVGSGDGAITLSGSADFNLTGALSSNVSGAGTTGDLSIASVVGSGDVTVVAGAGNLTVENNALTGEGTLTVDAAAMLDDNRLTISGAGDVVVTGALADVNLAGTSGTVTVTTSDDDVDTGESVETTVTLGTGATAIVNTDGSGEGNATVNIDALLAVAYLGEDELTNVDLNVTGDAHIVNITGLSADVDAIGFSGDTLNLTTVSGANIAVSGGDSDINLLGAAELVTVDATLTYGEDTLTIGQAAMGEDEAVAFKGDVTVTHLGTSGSGAVDAANLAGVLDVTTVAESNVTITLGAGVTEALLSAAVGEGTATVEATDFTNTLTLTGSGDVVVNDFNATIDADGVPSGNGVEAITAAFGDLDVTLAANAKATIIAGAHGTLTVTGGDIDGEDEGNALDGTRSTITIDAAAMTLDGASDQNIVINASSGASGGFNSNVVIDKVSGVASGDSAIEINLSGLNEEASTATVYITTGVLDKGVDLEADGDVLDITLGTSQFVTIEGTTGTVGAGNNGRVEIDASGAKAADFNGDTDTAKTNVQITLKGSADFTLSDVSADVNATAVTGNVVINADEASNDLTLSGGAGNDEIFAGSGDDTLNGGAGDDIIEGGVGVDQLTGGAGVDIFVFNAGDTGFGAGNRDVITDFQIGEDRIDLSAFNPSPSEFEPVIGFGDLNISYATAADGLTKTAIIGYDENGAESGGMVEIALTGLPLNDQLSANDFNFVATIA